MPVFRWKYILFPAVVLLLTAVLIGWFYRLLPEQVGYNFLADGSAGSWIGRGRMVLLALVPQFLLILLGLGVAWAMAWMLNRAGGARGAVLRPEGVLFVTGNMVVLPQIIIFFAMLDIFSYNSYQVHPLPLLAVSLIVMGGGAVILGVYFIRALMRVLAANKE